jgi:hypothetical protein
VGLGTERGRAEGGRRRRPSLKCRVLRRVSLPALSLSDQRLQRRPRAKGGVSAFAPTVEKIKTSFTNVGAYSNKDNFIRGDPEGVIEWISGEAEAFEEILSDHGDVCAFSGARGVSAVLEKVGCNHVKTLA